MYLFLSILIIICAVLLVLIVLVQNSKGGGLAAGFASSNQVLGVRKTTDFLEKFTWGLAAALIFLCVAITATLPSRKSAVASDSEVIENVSVPVSNGTPDFGTAQPVETPAEAAPAEQPVETPVQ